MRLASLKLFIVVMIVSVVIATAHINGVETQAATVRTAGAEMLVSGLTSSGLSLPMACIISAVSFRVISYGISLPWSAGQYIASSLKLSEKLPAVLTASR